MGVAKKTVRKTIRRSISLSREIDGKIQKLARHQNRSANQVLEHLIQTGLETKEAEKQHFFELAERLRSTENPSDLQQIKNEMARITFGS